jgi:hypothetical protein
MEKEGTKPSRRGQKTFLLEEEYVLWHPPLLPLLDPSLSLLSFLPLPCPWLLTPSIHTADFKALALEEKFQDLQKRGGLDTYIAKRQKRRAQKSQKFIPRSRRVIDAAPSSAPPPKRRRD